MAKKAEAWKTYSEGAYLEMVIKKLPELTRQLAKPLSGTDNVIIVGQSGPAQGGSGADKLTREMTSLMAQLPPIVQGLTGIDLNEALRQMVKQ